VEIQLEEVPGIQKKLIRRANSLGKPVITATQMLYSMVSSPRPTRAEATDVANAVMDGTDAVMLSEETATGLYPVESVQFIARIAHNAEMNYPNDRHLKLIPKKDVAESVAHTSCDLADHLDASAIIALSPNLTTVRQLALFWDCIPRLKKDHRNTDDMIKKAAAAALESGYVSKGDIVVITAGYPTYEAGTTNMMRVKRI
jgi:pyruvate kinase